MSCEVLTTQAGIRSNSLILLFKEIDMQDSEEA